MPVAYKPSPRSHTVVVARSAVGRPDYICDGTDDHVQIQAAIDSLGSDGGRVLIRKGTYDIGTTITIDISDVVIQGEGFDTILKAKNALNDYVITFDSTAAAIFGVSIRDLMIDGDATNQTDGGCIDAEGAVQCLFDFLRLYRPYHNGLLCDGVVAGGGSFGHHNRIGNCLFDEGDDSSGDGRGLRFNSSDENFVYACDFENNRDHILDEVGLNTIQQCAFVGGGDGVYANNSSRVHVINCYFDGVDGDNIHLKGSHHQVIGNNFFNIADGSTDNTKSGIYIETGDKCVISGNNMQSASAAGKTRSLIRDTSTGLNVISNNNLDQNGTFGTSIVEVTPTNNIFVGNRGYTGTSSGSGVTLGDTQTLTNKTLTTPAIAGSTITGVNDAGGADSFEIPNSAAPTVNADGEVAVDTTVTDFSHGILKYYGGEELAVVAMPIAQLTAPTNGYVVAYNSTNDEFELVAQSGSGSMQEIVFTPLSNEPPASAFATFDTRNSVPVLDFDESTDESAVFGGVLPSTYAGGGLTVTLVWMATSATTGGVSWDVAIEAHPDDTFDIDSDGFAAANNSGSVTTASATGEQQYTDIIFTDGADMDSLAAGQSFRLKVTRDADGTTATDDMAGDAELLRVIIKET